MLTEGGELTREVECDGRRIEVTAQVTGATTLVQRADGVGGFCRVVAGAPMYWTPGCRWEVQIEQYSYRDAHGNDVWRRLPIGNAALHALRGMVEVATGDTSPVEVLDERDLGPVAAEVGKWVI